MAENVLLEVDAVTKRFHRASAGLRRRSTFAAVDGVSLVLRAGQGMGLVGESGCGKSTLARVLLALERPDSGVVRLRGRSLGELSRRDLRGARRHMQLVPQDPGSSIDPRFTVGRAIAEPMVVHGVHNRRAAVERADELLSQVGMDSGAAGRRIHQFSGGQRQRIALARALAVQPDLIVADEPTSALDVLVQAQILNLLREAQSQLGLTLLFVSHNLGAVRHMCDTVSVMYAGQIVEVAPTEQLFARPAHHYTIELIEAVPTLARRATVSRVAPAASERLSAQGCPFAPRCPAATAVCASTRPPLVTLSPGRQVACHHPRVAPEGARR